LSRILYENINTTNKNTEYPFDASWVVGIGVNEEKTIHVYALSPQCQAVS